MLTDVMLVKCSIVDASVAETVIYEISKRTNSKMQNSLIFKDIGWRKEKEETTL
jgi:hypothetical protein